MTMPSALFAILNLSDTRIPKGCYRRNSCASEEVKFTQVEASAQDYTVLAGSRAELDGSYQDISKDNRKMLHFLMHGAI